MYEKMAGFSKFLNPECTININRNIIRYNPDLQQAILPRSQTLNGAMVHDLFTSKRKNTPIKNKFMDTNKLLYTTSMENNFEKFKNIQTWNDIIKYMERPEGPEIEHKMAKFIHEFEKCAPDWQPENPGDFLEIVRDCVDYQISVPQFIKIMIENK
jgi:hypothetical protein